MSVCVRSYIKKCLSEHVSMYMNVHALHLVKCTVNVCVRSHLEVQEMCLTM